MPFLLLLLLPRLFWNRSNSGIKQSYGIRIKSLLFPSRLLTEGYAGRIAVAKGHSWRSVCPVPCEGRCSYFSSRLHTSALHLPYWSGKWELGGKKWLWGRYPLEKTNSENFCWAVVACCSQFLSHWRSEEVRNINLYDQSNTAISK